MDFGKEFKKFATKDQGIELTISSKVVVAAQPCKPTILTIVNNLILISFLFNFCFFTCKISEIENTCSSDFTSFINFNFLNWRRINRENSFNAYRTRHFSNCKSFCWTWTSSLQNNTFKELCSCFITLSNFIINCDCISWTKRR